MLRLIVLGPFVIGLNAWTLEHTDICAFFIVLLASILVVFTLVRLLKYIDSQGSAQTSAQSSILATGIGGLGLLGWRRKRKALV